MSLEVRLISYKGGGTQGDRIVRASFRGTLTYKFFCQPLYHMEFGLFSSGASHLTKPFEDHGDWSEIQQVNSMAFFLNCLA